MPPVSRHSEKYSPKARKRADMNSKLKITLEPMTLDAGSDEEKAAFGQLQIKAGGRILTAGADFSGNEPRYRPGPYVSGYHLAEWLIWNWWRLHWEPEPDGQDRADHEWQLAHCLASVGEGYAWPNITISTGGQWTTLVSRPSPERASFPFRYSEAGAAVVPSADLESAIDEFAAFIVNRMDAAGLPATNLHLLRQDLQSERNDPEKTRFRQLEARLGYDPDELDAAEAERLGRNR